MYYIINVLLSSWPSSFRKACKIVLKWTYLNNKCEEIVIVMIMIFGVQFMYWTNGELPKCDSTETERIANLKETKTLEGNHF